MYVDKLNGKITEAMYKRLYKKLIDEAKQKEREYIEIQEMQNTSKQDDSENIKKLVKEFLKLKEPTPEVMKVIVNRIEIHQDKQVDLYFNFKQLNNITQNCLLWHLPEGISMAVPMKNGGMEKSKVIFYVVLSGITTGIGAFLGALVGGISKNIIIFKFYQY